MDVILQRFPVAVQDIFKQLDDKSLANCREVSKICRNFLDNDSLLWRRRIQKYDKNQTEFQEAWKLVTTKVPIEKLREIALAVEKFYKLDLKEELENQHSPLHIGAAIGNISICEYIVERTRMVNPARIDGTSPLHFASFMGHLEIVKYIVGHLENKNPAMNNGWTPLHFAAKHGHLEIVKYIAGNLDNKNPSAENGDTPLSLAQNAGQFEVANFLNMVIPND